MPGPEPEALELGESGGAPIRLAWDPEPPLSAEDDGPPRSPWTLHGRLDAARFEVLRLFSAALDDGRRLGLAALRPLGAAGHDADLVAARLVDDGEPVEVTEALVSTQYDRDGVVTRIGIEVWTEESPPLRIAADQPEEVRVAGADGGARPAVRFECRAESAAGSALLELVDPR